MVKEKHFPYATDVVTKKQYEEHLRLYQGYVKKINEITDVLFTDGDRKDANATYSKYRGLKRGETYSTNGVLLHEMYFQNMGETNEDHPKVLTAKIINDAFESYQKWEEDFIACGRAARGWCILAYDQLTRTYKNFLLDSHDDGMVCMCIPILILDVYEHAYFMDYGTEREAYIKKFIKGVRWDVVERRVYATQT